MYYAVKLLLLFKHSYSLECMPCTIHLSMQPSAVASPLLLLPMANVLVQVHSLGLLCPTAVILATSFKDQVLGTAWPMESGVEVHLIARVSYST